MKDELPDLKERIIQDELGKMGARTDWNYRHIAKPAEAQPDGILKAVCRSIQRTERYTGGT